MQDLCSGAIKLDTFRGVAFVGGFSYADVLGSAKGQCAGFCPLPTHTRLRGALAPLTGPWPLTSTRPRESVFILGHVPAEGLQVT